jgi:hypothetical protein
LIDLRLNQKNCCKNTKNVFVLQLLQLLQNLRGVLSLRAADTEACCHFAPPKGVGGGDCAAKWEAQNP